MLAETTGFGGYDLESLRGVLILDGFNVML